MLTDYVRNNLLKTLVGKQESFKLTGKCYLGLMESAPTVSGGNITEPSVSSYERIQLCISSALEWTDLFSEVSNGTVHNAKEICSRECKEDDGWGSLTYFGIFDAEKDGHLLAYDRLTDPEGLVTEGYSLNIEKSNVAVFREGTLQLTLT